MDLSVTYQALPRRERYLTDIMEFETLVMNGRLDGYLWGCGGDHALECLEALQAIGATKAHALLQSACELFPEHRPASEREMRQRQLHQITNDERKLGDLVTGDIEFELYELFLKYWDANGPAESGL